VKVDELKKIDSWYEDAPGPSLPKGMIEFDCRWGNAYALVKTNKPEQAAALFVEWKRNELKGDGPWKIQVSVKGLKDYQTFVVKEQISRTYSAELSTVTF
jgi:hypothetical protein